MAKLGTRKYSLWFPLVANLLLPIASEVFAHKIAQNPNIVGAYIIFFDVAFTIYFAFRDGMRAGFISTFGAVLYYFYIVFTRHYKGQQFFSAVETIFMLALVYAVIALIIGWLKERIDTLIQKEMDARRLAEEGKVRLQTILQQLPVGVLLVTADGGLEGNKQTEKILGRKIEKTLPMDKGYLSPYPYRLNNQLKQKEWPIIRALQKGEIVKAEEIEYRQSDKKRLYLRVNAAPIRNKNKKIIAAVSTLYDITQEKEAELRKDDFVNMASHELKTPLTSMKLYIELLAKQLGTYNDEKAIRTIQRIKRQTEKLQELVNDLLDVSRIHTGKLLFKQETFQISDLIEETVETLQATTQGHKIIFAEKQPFLVYADKFRIDQVLTNLITNAMKYSSENKDIIIRVGKEKEYAVVSVQDFGIGIAKEQQKKIFDRLYQVTGNTEKTFPGLGMGLYISREIIKRHKGAIWVESEKGKGSIFYFRLPRVRSGN